MTTPLDWLISIIKASGKVYHATVTSHLRSRSEAMARGARTASVIRLGSVKLHWYEGPAAAQLQREGHGVIRDGYYQTAVNVTPPGVLMAMAIRERLST